MVSVPSLVPAEKMGGGGHRGTATRKGMGSGSGTGWVG